MQELFKSNAVLKFWKHFDAFSDASKLGTTDFQVRLQASQASLSFKIIKNSN